MLNFVLDIVFLRGVFLDCFNLKKISTEIHCISVEFYVECVKSGCWFAKFKSGDFGLKGEERPRRRKNLEDDYPQYQSSALYLVG